MSNGNNDKKLILFSKYSLIYGILFSLSITIGRRVYNTHDLFTSSYNIVFDIFLFLLISFVVAFLTERIFILLNKCNLSHKLLPFFSKNYSFLICWTLIFISFIPALLAYYPGINSYDSYTQTMVATGVYGLSNFHPILHTEIWHICLIISDIINKNAATIYALLQMLLLSYSLSKVADFVGKKGNTVMLILTLLYFCFNPAITVFSIIMTKDPFFSALFVLVIIEICKMIGNVDEYIGNIKKWVKLSLLIFIVCWFRNNCFYALMLGFLIFIAIYRKNIKRLLLIFVIPLVVFYLSNTIILNIFNISKSPIQEMLCVPTQQIARVVYQHNDEIDQNTKKQINKFINYRSLINNFNYRYTDPVKDNFVHLDLREDLSDFFDVYFKLFKKYPKEYISEALDLNIPYWYQFSSLQDPLSKRSMIETYNYGYNDEYRDSKLPFLYDYYESVANYELLNKTPFISWLYSLALPIWLLFFLLMYYLKQKDKLVLLVLMPLITLWLTYIVGPVSSFRYILPMIMLYPLLIFLPFIRNNKHYSKI